jgi:uncharacterized membrane protein YozB (DUF420 family)
MRQETLLTTTAKTRRFFIGVGGFMLVLSAVAFGPALLQPSGRRMPLPLSPLVAVHAVVSVAWLLLFLVQATLVAKHRTDLHRRLGVAGLALAIVFVVVGWNASIEEARRGFDMSGDLIPAGTTEDPVTALVPLNAFLLFGLLVGLSLWYRNRPEVHKRLMVLAMVGPVAGAPLAHLVGHWPLIRPIASAFFAIASLSLLALCPLYDRIRRGRVHPASSWGAVGVFLWGIVFFLIVPATTAWRDFTTWLVR